mgnify:CR=1 FL=1
MPYDICMRLGKLSPSPVQPTEFAAAASPIRDFVARFNARFSQYQKARRRVRISRCRSCSTRGPEIVKVSKPI